MENYRAIPHGYMTVGEAAKKMGVTVRTLQYYDREGLLSPSAESEGGRRLYTDKDLILLYQIISLKLLGFTLGEIKERLVSPGTPEDVADALAEQAEAIRKRIGELSASLTAVERLREEALQMRSVDLKKYADIIVNLRMNNEYYFLIKKFDDDTLDHVRRRFDRDSAADFIGRFGRLSDEILRLREENVPPESERCQRLAKAYWDMIVEFTGGDMSMLPKLAELNGGGDPEDGREEKQALVNAYLEPALEKYFSEAGIDPRGEARDE